MLSYYHHHALHEEQDELLGKLLGSIQSPITNFARVLNQIAEAQGGADTEAAAE